MTDRTPPVPIAHNPQHAARIAEATARAEGCDRTRIAAEAAHAAALVAVDTARAGLETAERLAAEATEAHASALAAADTAAKTWEANQSAATWTRVENARGTRDQADLRARSLTLAAQNARADLATTELRAARARADLDTAIAAHRRAADALEGFRADATAADEAAAAEEGARRRAAAALAAARAGHPETRTAAYARELTRAAVALMAFETSLARLDAAHAAVYQEARALVEKARDAGESFFGDAPPDLRASVPGDLLAAVVRALHPDGRIPHQSITTRILNDRPVVYPSDAPAVARATLDAREALDGASRRAPAASSPLAS